MRLEGNLTDCERSLPSYCASGTCHWRQGSLHELSCERFDFAALTFATSFQPRTNTCSNHYPRPSSRHHNYLHNSNGLHGMHGSHSSYVPNAYSSCRRHDRKYRSRYDCPDHVWRRQMAGHEGSWGSEAQRTREAEQRRRQMGGFGMRRW